MIIGFLTLNVIIFFCTCLGIVMFANNLKRISKSMDVYLDPKAYKPKNQVEFISLLVDRYEAYKNKSQIDMDLLIYDYFYNYKIGKFRPSGIESLAKKGKKVLWTSIITMTLVEVISIGLGQSWANSIMIIISAFLGISLSFFEMYMNIEIGKERLFLKIKSHLTNEYPQYQAFQKEKQEISLLLNKINKLEAQIKYFENNELDHKQDKQIENNQLKEEDIVNILRCFDVFQM